MSPSEEQIGGGANAGGRQVPSPSQPRRPCFLLMSSWRQHARSWSSKLWGSGEQDWGGGYLKVRTEAWSLQTETPPVACSHSASLNNLRQHLRLKRHRRAGGVISQHSPGSKLRRGGMASFANTQSDAKESACGGLAPSYHLQGAGPSSRWSQGITPRHLLAGICYSECPRGEVRSCETVGQFTHTPKLLVIQPWEGVGRGPAVFHTLHWKGF